MPRSQTRERERKVGQFSRVTKSADYSVTGRTNRLRRGSVGSADQLVQWPPLASGSGGSRTITHAVVTGFAQKPRSSTSGRTVLNGSRVTRMPHPPASIRCPKCKSPIFEAIEVPDDLIAWLVCSQCRHTWCRPLVPPTAEIAAEDATTADKGDGAPVEKTTSTVKA